MTIARAGLIAAALLAATGAVAAQPETGQAVAAPGAPPATASQKPFGYLAASQRPDLIHLLGPPPPPGSGAATGDVATFKATRLRQGDARWTLATSDAVYASAAVLQDFSCALGVELTPATAPLVRHVIDRLGADAGAAVSVVKRNYHRPRPFVDNGGPICVPEDAELRRSYSYPSGHSTYGWTVGLMLAQLAPDRAAPVLARAKVFGESRVICGVHYESDVVAGRVAADALFATLQADPAFRRDLAAARQELDRLRAQPAAPPAGRCRIEADAEAQPIW